MRQVWPWADKGVRANACPGAHYLDLQSRAKRPTMAQLLASWSSLHPPPIRSAGRPRISHPKFAAKSAPDFFFLVICARRPPERPPST